MTKDCANPYCPDPKKGTRSPTRKEISRLRDELHNQPLHDELRKDFLNMLDKKQVTVEICTVCGTWIAATWDSQQGRMTRQFIASPFRFNVGDRVRVALEGKHCGMVGIITRRTRLSKAITPPPPPDNVYYLVFKGDSQEYGYSEVNLALPSKNG